MFTNQIYKFKNESRTMKQWAQKIGLSVDVLRSRWNKGKRGDSLFAPIPDQDEQNSYCVYITHDTGDGEETKTLKEWAQEFNMNPKTLAARYGKGERDSHVLLRPKGVHAKVIKQRHRIS